jgi:hypothetical protein
MNLQDCIASPYSRESLASEIMESIASTLRDQFYQYDYATVFSGLKIVRLIDKAANSDELLFGLQHVSDDDGVYRWIVSCIPRLVDSNNGVVRFTNREGDLPFKYVEQPVYNSDWQIAIDICADILQREKMKSE